MKTETPRNGGLALLAGALIIAASLIGSVAADEMVSWDDLPAAVQETIEAKLPSAVGMDVERESEDGVIVYEAEIDVDGFESEIKVTESGTLVEFEKELDPDNLPPEIRAALDSVFPDAEILEAELMMEVTYEVDLRVNDQWMEVEISPWGELLIEIESEEDENEDEDDDDEEGEDDDD